MRTLFQLCLAIVLVTVAFSSSKSFAQTNTASVRGTVLDPQEHPVVDAVVSLENTDLSFRRTASTDAHGAFHFSNLVPGNYALKSNFGHLSSPHPVRLTVGIGSTTDVTVKLTIPAIQQSAHVSARAATVEGNTVAPAINTDDPAAKTFLPGLTVTYLPLRDRDFSQFAQLAADDTEDIANNGIIVSGQRSSRSLC